MTLLSGQGQSDIELKLQELKDVLKATAQANGVSMISVDISYDADTDAAHADYSVNKSENKQVNLG